MEIPRHWRLKAQRYRLESPVCPICGQPIFPSRPLCPRCTAQRARIADRRARIVRAPIVFPGLTIGMVSGRLDAERTVEELRA